MVVGDLAAAQVNGAGAAESVQGVVAVAIGAKTPFRPTTVFANGTSLRVT